MYSRDSLRWPPVTEKDQKLVLSNAKSLSEKRKLLKPWSNLGFYSKVAVDLVVECGLHTYRTRVMVDVWQPLEFLFLFFWVATGARARVPTFFNQAFCSSVQNIMRLIFKTMLMMSSLMSPLCLNLAIFNFCALGSVTPQRWWQVHCCDAFTHLPAGKQLFSGSRIIATQWRTDLIN